MNLISGRTAATSAPSAPAPATLRKYAWLATRFLRDRQTQRDPRYGARAIIAAAWGKFQGSDNSLARTFAVPAGNTASGTWLHARPFTASLTVPSPPQTITSWRIVQRLAARARWHRPGRLYSGVRFRSRRHGKCAAPRQAETPDGLLPQVGLTISTASRISAGTRFAPSRVPIFTDRRYIS